MFSYSTDHTYSKDLLSRLTALLARFVDACMAAETAAAVAEKAAAVAAVVVVVVVVAAAAAAGMVNSEAYEKAIENYIYAPEPAEPVNPGHLCISFARALSSCALASLLLLAFQRLAFQLALLSPSRRSVCARVPFWRGRVLSARLSGARLDALPRAYKPLLL